MNRFIVISPDAERIQVAVQENFPDYHYKILPEVWVVADTNKGPSDICGMLGIGKGAREGMVFDLNAYYGLYNPTLWEKLNLWEGL